VTDEVAAERNRLIAEQKRLRKRENRHRRKRIKDAFPFREQANEIRRQYRELLPEVTVARCPHSGDLVRWPIDTYGLDGWFWQYLGSARRTPASLPRAWLAMTGAMRLAKPVEHPPFVVMPGPGVPFVVPRILESPGVRAVIAEVPVGVHTGWAISYFGPKPPNTGLVNVWGTDSYPVYRDGVRGGWNSVMPWVEDYDFDLTGWLRSGSLLWIAPGDSSATLREGLDGCPYVDLPGKREFVVVFKDSVWHMRAFAGPAGEA
jgi:hypothetical protein